MIYDTFDSLNKTVSIPIRYANGKIEYFYGGKLPKLKDGVIGELILPAYAVEDKKFLENKGWNSNFLQRFLLWRETEIL